MTRGCRVAGLHALGFCLALMTAAVAQGSSTLQETVHEPLVVDNDDLVTITGIFAAGQGIRSIDITAASGEMEVCPGRPESLFPCQKAPAVLEYQRCPFHDYRPASAAVSCVFKRKKPFDRNSLVTYQATALTRDGQTLRAQEVTFAQGNPPGALARPIFWHSDAPSGSKLVVGFFPDGDYGGDEGYPDFLKALKGLLSGTFDGKNTYNRLYAEARPNFDLWAGPSGAIAMRCVRSLGAAAKAAAMMKGVVIVHKNYFNDCSSIGLGGEASVFASPDGPYILVHESGHFLHGLGDEYGCGGAHETRGDCRNVFADKDACQKYACEHHLGCESGRCAAITCGDDPLGWRVSAAPPEIMKDELPASDWRLASLQCVQDRLAQCLISSCYPGAGPRPQPVRLMMSPAMERSAVDATGPRVLSEQWHEPAAIESSQLRLNSRFVPAFAVTFTVEETDEGTRVTHEPPTRVFAFGNFSAGEDRPDLIKVSLCPDAICAGPGIFSTSVADEDLNVLEGVGLVRARVRTFTVIVRAPREPLWLTVKLPARDEARRQIVFDLR